MECWHPRLAPCSRIGAALPCCSQPGRLLNFRRATRRCLSAWPPAERCGLSPVAGRRPDRQGHRRAVHLRRPLSRRVRQPAAAFRWGILQQQTPPCLRSCRGPVAEGALQQIWSTRMDSIPRTRPPSTRRGAGAGGGASLPSMQSGRACQAASKGSARRGRARQAQVRSCEHLQ